jgi:8-oxo-dGTP pyrophosphatase MutT (NUDIX family)
MGDGRERRGLQSEALGNSERVEGPPVEPRQAASVIVLRDSSQGLQLLLVERTPEARFMAGVWVFPGGAVDHGADGRPATEASGAPRADAPHRAAAVRELREEAGIVLADAGQLVEYSRWITPARLTTRFDTRFYLTAMPAGQQPTVDGRECVDFRWFTPAAALAAYEAGEVKLVLPTIKHIEQLSSFASVEELLRFARGRDVVTVEPKIVKEGGVACVLLPGEPGYT